MASSNIVLYIIGAIALVFLISTVAFLVLPIQLPLTGPTGSGGGNPTVTISLYAGEIASGKYGFGLSADNLTSPGPTFRFKTSDVVKITLTNAGHVPHAFAVVNAPKTGATVLFGATIASGSNPLAPGQSGSVTFKPTTVSDQYYYICPVPGHAELGMWGTIIVTSG